jgi:hypothetical protein
MPAMTATQEYLAPSAGAAGARGAVELTRRGVRHGAVREPRRPPAVDPARRGARAEARERWAAARPIHLPGALARRLECHADGVRATRAWFESLRRGAAFEQGLWRRLARTRAFEPAGVTIDLGDAREIEKVFAHARARGRVVARDLWAKLSWISVDERDVSLRIRFSFGVEQLMEWQAETRRAPWADRLAAAVFPECAVLTGHRGLLGLIETACGQRVRCSERIVYNNAPGGGAVFHHDVEPHQLGVLYGQLAGETGWLALPKRDLAAEVAGCVSGTRLERKARTPRAALRWLEEQGDEDLLRLLNHTPRFTRRLVERGDFIRLRAGDALLLPSPGRDEVCWHSVFALGRRASLAHSYGLFGLRRRRQPSASS